MSRRWRRVWRSGNAKSKQSCMRGRESRGCRNIQRETGRGRCGSSPRKAVWRRCDDGVAALRWMGWGAGGLVSCASSQSTSWTCAQEEIGPVRVVSKAHRHWGRTEDSTMTYHREMELAAGTTNNRSWPLYRGVG
jgi:hypothetical protein